MAFTVAGDAPDGSLDSACAGLSGSNGCRFIRGAQPLPVT